MLDEMIEVQLQRRGIHNPRVLNAMRKVRRQEFVPAELKESAYKDEALPIGHQQTISQPYIVAYMTQVLDIQPEDRILEIGTGTGYQTAILAELAKEVYSIELVGPLYASAFERLSNLKYKNISLRCSDGWEGWPEKAPFDKIIVTAAADHVPRALIDQLKEKGKMSIPVGPRNQNQDLLLGSKTTNGMDWFERMPVRFVPLIHADEHNEGRKHGEEKS